MPLMYKGIDWSALSDIGKSFGEMKHKQNVGDALAKLGPNASANDLAQTLIGIGETDAGLKLKLMGMKEAAKPDPIAQAQSISEAKARGAQTVKDEVANRDKDAAKGTISSDLLDVSGAIADLDKRGALVNPDQPNTWKNIGNYGRATGLGQSVEGMLGTPEQASRDLISQIQPGLMSKIRQATQQGARGLDSNIELQFYMKQVGDVKSGKMVNYSAMDRLDRAYGDGKLLDTLLQKGAINQEEFNKIRSHHFSLPGGVKETDLSTPYDAGAEAPQYKKGQTATNRKTGQKMMFDGTQWVPAQ